LNILAYQLSAPLARGPYPDLSAWTHVLTSCPFTGQVERALWAGFHADRIAYAFVGGYSAALARLFEHAARASGTPVGRAFPSRLSLCATEAGGAHPKKIATRLDKQGGSLVLNGEKTFATLATAADELLVVASRGIEADGRNRLRLVRVSPNAKGVEIVAKAPLPFAPELPHAVVRFVDVVVDDDDVLPGDGYDHYLKPFRTIEDTHVLAATVGYLLGAARAHGFDQGIVMELVSLSLSLVDVGARDATAPLTHVILAGLFGSVRRLGASLGPSWDQAPEDERTRWQRDQPILMVADGVRAQRTAAAWKAMTSPISPS
jgi:acyl-CoA dehydrogenase